MNQDPKAFSRPDAENLVRAWNLFYNRTIAYAFEHPVAQEMIPKVHEAFLKCLGQNATLSLLFQEFGFYIGHIDIVYQPNNRKIADHLRRFGIESVTITMPLSFHDTSRFLDACSVTHAGGNHFLQYLTNQGVNAFNVNNVSLQTVKEGDTVIAHGQSREGLSEGNPSSTVAGELRKERSVFDDAAMKVVLGHLTAQEMNANISLLRVLESPSALPDAILKTTLGNPGHEEQSLKQSLINVVGAFKNEAGQGNVPIEDLLAGMYNMRSELLKAVKAQQGLSQHLQSGSDRSFQMGNQGLSNAADEVFIATAAQLVFAEYQKCQGNPKRMAQVIQRIIQDRHHLNKVLNLFRTELLKNGIPLIEFFNLLTELNSILGADQSYQEFIQAGKSLGISQEELLRELQENPKQAAQLIVLASEARKVNKDGSAEDLIGSLADYVEKAGEAIANRMDTHPKEAIRLTSMLHQMEVEVHRELAHKGLSDEVRIMGQQKLRHRMQHSIIDLKGKAALAQLRDAGTSEAEKIQFLMEMFTDEKEMDDIVGQIRETLDQDTVAKEVGAQVMLKARQEMATRREKMMSKELPAGVYVKAVLDFIVKSEISRSIRYNLPFSAMLVSFQGLPEDKASHEQHGESLRGLQNVLIGDLRKSMRDSDFVGYLSFNRFLVVMPMTKVESVASILKKFQENLNRQVALPNGTRLVIRARCGISGFDKDLANTFQKIYGELVKSWQSATNA